MLSYLNVTFALITSILLSIALNEPNSHTSYKLPVITQVFHDKNTLTFSHFDISVFSFIFPLFELIKINFACMKSKATNTVHKNASINVLYEAFLRRPLYKSYLFIPCNNSSYTFPSLSKRFHGSNEYAISLSHAISLLIIRSMNYFGMKPV